MGNLMSSHNNSKAIVLECRLQRDLYILSMLALHPRYEDTAAELKRNPENTLPVLRKLRSSTQPDSYIEQLVAAAAERYGNMLPEDCQGLIHDFLAAVEPTSTPLESPTNESSTILKHPTQNIQGDAAQEGKASATLLTLQNTTATVYDLRPHLVNIWSPANEATYLRVAAFQSNSDDKQRRLRKVRLPPLLVRGDYVEIKFEEDNQGGVAASISVNNPKSLKPGQTFRFKNEALENGYSEDTKFALVRDGYLGAWLKMNITWKLLRATFIEFDSEKLADA